MTRIGADTATTPFQRAARDLLESNPDATPLDLATSLDFLTSADDDAHADWHPSSKPFDAMVRTYFLQLLTDWSDRETIETITKNTEVATKFGFEPDNLPSRSTLTRARNNRLSEPLKASLKWKAGWVESHVRETGHPLATQALAPEDKSTHSRRSVSRFIREKLDTVPREIVRLIAAELDDWIPDRADNARYHLNSFIETECTMGLTCTAAEQGSEIYNDNTNREGGGPGGDVFMDYTKQLERADVLRMLHNSTGLMLNTAKRHLEFERPAIVAIDITLLPFYGDTDHARQSEWIVDTRKRPDTEYDWCYRYATISIVGENVKFMLGLKQVHEDDNMGILVEELLDKALHHVRIDTVYADRAFASADVLNTLNQRPVRYVIPVRLNSRIKNDIRRMKHDVEVTHEYPIHGNVRGGVTNEEVKTTRVLLPSIKSEDDEAGTVAFYTNLDVDDGLEVERKWTEKVINRYRRRWGIESAFQSLKTFLPWTSSKEPVVRLFHFAFGILLYNMWRLIDFLIQLSIDEVEVRTKPRLKAKRFINAVKSRKLLA
jgi:hypothetical protein